MNTPDMHQIKNALSRLLLNAEDKQAYINLLESKEQFDENGKTIVTDSPEMEAARNLLATL